MPDHHQTLEAQITLIRIAMENAGVWAEKTPPWVHAYTDGTIPDIWQWMQFIYLPMRLQGTLKDPDYLAPQLNAHIKQNPAFTPILQLTIELDALTPTFQKS